jgi:uncharacterized protein (DUF2141 family)
MKKFYFLISVSCLAALMGFTSQKPVKLIIRASGFKSDNGKLQVQIFNREDGYPGKPEKAFRKYTGVIKSGSAEVVINDLPQGEYAISLLHDENDNKKADTNWLGIPKEGLGASNNAKGSFGPPAYEDAKFKIGGEDVVQLIKINYL